MSKKPVLKIFFAALMFCLPLATAQTATKDRPQTDSQAVAAQKAPSPNTSLPADGNLPESASALPLLSTIGAGALLGGLLSARRTRVDK